MIPSLFFSYIKWHYTQGYKDILYLWKNFLQFFYNFFSIRVLILTLFSPFKNMHEERKVGFDIKDILSVIIVNSIMRVVGFIIKSILIIAGATVSLVTLILGVFSFLVWGFIPFIILIIFILGISFVI